MSDAAITFGRYELQTLLAVGGMAEIFLARTRLGGITRTCVIKRILPEYSTSRPFVSMFIDEARITIGLEHEHIVKLIDFGQVDGAYFMAIEYVDGCDLVEVLRAVKARHEGVPPLAAAYIARCMARGLHAAHIAVDHRGQPMHIVHRDVSPQNVFLSWQGGVKIGDFGIASASNKLHGKTVPGTIKGKYGYMSPEQSFAARVDPRADVWACGVVLWEMLVGGRLFATDSPVDTIARVNEMPVPAPSSLRADVPAVLDAIVLQTLQRPLSLRTADCGALADALDAYIGGEVSPPAPQGVRSSTKPQSRFSLLPQVIGGEVSPPAPQGVRSSTKPQSRFSLLPQAIDGAFTAVDLAALLPSLGLSRAALTATRQRGRAIPSIPLRERTSTVAPGDARLRALYEEFQQGQRLWTLVDIGERYAALGQRPQALAAIRTAAAVFSHRGLLVQAVCAIHCVRPLVDKAAFDDDLLTVGLLRGHDREHLVAHLQGFEHREFFTLVREADPAGLGVEHTEQTISHDVTPLLGAVSIGDFVRLARLCRVERKPRGATIVREGERSDALYAVGRGRVVVGTSSTTDPASGSAGRVYLAALTDGDFFGEFSFLTQSPRSATVEADTDVLILRLDRAAVDELVSADSAFRAPLLEFYKERVAELLLAKNPIIGALPPEARRGLIKDAEVRSYVDGDVIVAEGDDATELFFILNGEVEIHKVEQGIPVFINKLHEGQFFGEMAALQHKRRTASVHAMGGVEVLCVARDEIERLLAAADDVRHLFDKAMALRAAESDERVLETARIFQGV